MPQPVVEMHLNRLAAPVAKYGAGPFRLSEDLDRLGRVRGAAAPEAVILYCARILEVLAADALRAIELEPAPNVFANLDSLQQYNLIPTPTLYWAHALRRTGNLVRHIRGRLEPHDSELALLFAERWLEWFFHDFRHGMKVELTCDGRPLGLSAHAGLRDVLAALENLDQHADVLLAHVETGPESEFFWAPDLPAVLAGMFLERGMNDKARLVLDAARKKFPDDLRLNQLIGLFHSRTGDFERALQYLEPLCVRYGDDSETAGITAGVYKRRWLADRDCKKWLEMSLHAYRKAWKQSQKTCAYLGINVATIALFLGKADEAKALAAEIRDQLCARAAVLQHHAASDQDIGLNYWDLVTLAEAELIAGNPAQARTMYNKAFTIYAEQTGNIKGTRGQLEAILPCVGYSGSAADFLTNSSR